MLLDGPRGTKTGRNLRAAAINTIAHSTGAAKAIGKVVPSVNGKLQGHAQRVQVPDGSVTELTTVLNTETTADEINAAFKAAFSDTDYYATTMRHRLLRHPRRHPRWRVRPDPDRRQHH